MTAVLLFDKRDEIKKENPVYLKRFGTMYGNLKQTRSWYHYQYYSIFLIRRLLFVVFLIFASDYPELQCNVFIMLTLMVRMNT